MARPFLSFGRALASAGAAVTGVVAATTATVFTTPGRSTTTAAEAKGGTSNWWRNQFDSATGGAKEAVATAQAAVEERWRQQLANAVPPFVMQLTRTAAKLAPSLHVAGDV
jgi:hypothetical protein